MVDDTQQRQVLVSRLVDGGNGVSRFEDASIPYAKRLGPLHLTEATPASAIRFHCLPSGYEGNAATAAGRSIVLIIEGAADVIAGDAKRRTFRPGDVLEVATAENCSLKVAGDEDCRAAVITFEQQDRPVPPPQSASRSLPYVRNRTGVDNQSHFEDGALPYFANDAGSLATDDIAITAYQFVLAQGDLSFGFHNAPQRQIVLPLTGGMEGENGDGSRRRIGPGELYFGEDTTGQGHITRALDGHERLSIFAFLP